MPAGFLSGSLAGDIQKGQKTGTRPAPCCWFAVPVGVALRMTVRTSWQQYFVPEAVVSLSTSPNSAHSLFTVTGTNMGNGNAPSSESKSQLCMVPPICSWETVAARQFSFPGALDPALQGSFYKPYTFLVWTIPTSSLVRSAPGGHQDVLLIFQHLVARFHK